MFRKSGFEFAPVGVYSLTAAKIKTGDDWDRKPGDFNKKDLKGDTPLFHPPPIKQGDSKIPEKKAVIDQYATLQVGGDFGYDFYLHPEQYNSHDLPGLPLPELPPFVVDTLNNKANAVETHFKMINQIHPEKAIAKAIPEAQAEADKQKAENEMKAAQLSAFADAEKAR
jgi:hypothetical protein